MAGRFAALLLLFAVGSVGPGFILVRRLPWSPPEKLSGAVALSLLLLFLASFTIFLLELPPYAHLLVSAGSAGLVALAGKDLVRVLQHRSVRRHLAGFGFLLAWSLALLALVRHYSGGLWAGDWLEHYERAVFFLDHLPRDTVFIGLYQLPARPPMMNVLAAHYLAQVGRSFDLFQVVFLLLNLLIVLPLLLIAPALVRRASGRTLLIIGFLAASPMLLQNVTWTWTKLGAGFYVILAVWLYLRAWKKGDPLRMTLAFAALATGLLVHYSVGPYALVLGLHYGAVVLRGRQRRWRELASLGLAGAVVLLPWIGWSLAVYGPRTTFASNTTVAGASAVSAAENLARTGVNLVNSLVPHPLREAGRQYMRTWFQQASTLGYVRDYTFLIYQVNAAAALGVVGAALALYLLYQRFRTAPPRARGDLGFWTGFIVLSFVLGIAVHGQRDDVGLVHICLQPLVLLGVVFVAASVPDLPAWMRGVALAGCAVDFLVGILLHFGMENRVGTIVTSPSGEPMVLNTAGLSQVAALAWGYRAAHSMVFFGDHFVPLAMPIGVTLGLGYATLLALMWRRVMVAAPVRPTRDDRPRRPPRRRR